MQALRQMQHVFHSLSQTQLFRLRRCHFPSNLIASQRIGVIDIRMLANVFFQQTD